MGDPSNPLGRKAQPPALGRVSHSQTCSVGYAVAYVFSSTGRRRKSTNVATKVRCQRTFSSTTVDHQHQPSISICAGQARLGRRGRGSNPATPTHDSAIRRPYRRRRSRSSGFRPTRSTHISRSAHTGAACIQRWLKTASGKTTCLLCPSACHDADPNADVRRPSYSSVRPSVDSWENGRGSKPPVALTVIGLHHNYAIFLLKVDWPGSRPDANGLTSGAVHIARPTEGAPLQ